MTAGGGAGGGKVISAPATASLKASKNAETKNYRKTSDGTVILLESPDLILDTHSRFNRASFRTFFECSGPWKLLIANRR